MNVLLPNWKACAGFVRARARVCVCVCVSDPMTHLWLRVTLGSGPLKQEPAALAASEHT